MFTLKNWKTKFVYIGFGSLFGCLCTIIGMLASPVTAQRDKFGDIECTSLRVVDADGVAQVILSTSMLDMAAPRGVVWIGNDILGGRVGIVGIDGKLHANLGVDGDGGHVRISGKNGNSTVSLLVGDHGGAVGAFGKDGKMWAWLGTTEHGGRVAVYGKGEGTAVMGINEYGNGAVSTWDKNGYRQ